MPWLVAEVSQEIESIITSRDVITGEPYALILCFTVVKMLGT